MFFVNICNNHNLMNFKDKIKVKKSVRPDPKNESVFTNSGSPKWLIVKRKRCDCVKPQHVSGSLSAPMSALPKAAFATQELLALRSLRMLPQERSTGISSRKKTCLLKSSDRPRSVK